MPEDIQCVVFWTKNPAPILNRLPELDDRQYHYYFLFTLTPYDNSIEVKVPPIDERISTFQALAGRIGHDRVFWRYDPILFTNRYTPAFHISAFTKLTKILAGFTKVCIISFVEMYRKCVRNMRNLRLMDLPVGERIAMIQAMQEIAGQYSITLQTCSGSGLELSGIKPGKCIDDKRIAKLTDFAFHGKKDKNQRRNCGCIESIDIGAYNSCPHNCLYCYANNDNNATVRNFSTHNPESPLLCGTLVAGDKVTQRKVKPITRIQRSLF